MSPRVLGLGVALALLAGAALAAPPAPKKPVPQSPYAKDFVGTWDMVGSINFDPTILPGGITVSDDPFPAARSAAYARSFDLRTAEEKDYPRDGGTQP